ncbi:MAG: NAD(P)/FAD-dependent oxidoreductase [Candidatus Magnetoovum sp. WYHC-5]|nr:NAD(P)/FAD-dependent oxidoreductase [Candidatus Magnetoovum sp. WYHC-5]
MEYDIIVVGGGLGGLTAGALLAQSGKRVFLVEQQMNVGGCARIFSRKEYTFDAGLHELDGLDELDLKKEVFQKLGVFNSVEFIKLPEFYRFIHGKTDIVIPNGREKAMKVLLKRFPHESDGITKYFDVLKRIRKEIYDFPCERWKSYVVFPLMPFIFPNLFRYGKKTAGSFIDSIIKDDELKLILFANHSFYHDNPYELSLLFYAAVQDSYYSGSYYIKGGSQVLSNYLARIITENGGQVLLGHTVREIIVRHNEVRGIKYVDSENLTGRLEEIYAKVVVANAAIPNVINELTHRVKTSKLKKVRNRINKLKASPSMLSIYLCLKRPLKSIGNKHYITFVYDKDITKPCSIKNVDYAQRGYVFVDYSQIDSGLVANNRGVGVISIIDYLSNWEYLTDNEYTEKKKELAKIFINRLEGVLPGIKKEIEYYDVSTPQTIKHFTKNPCGSIYGYSQIPAQAGLKRMDINMPIKNLFFASAWSFPGGGFTGTIIGGSLCANKVLRALKE